MILFDKTLLEELNKHFKKPKYSDPLNCFLLNEIRNKNRNEFTLRKLSIK